MRPISEQFYCDIEDDEDNQNLEEQGTTTATPSDSYSAEGEAKEKEFKVSTFLPMSTYPQYSCPPSECKLRRPI